MRLFFALHPATLQSGSVTSLLARVAHLSSQVEVRDGQSSLSLRRRRSFRVRRESMAPVPVWSCLLAPRAFGPLPARCCPVMGSSPSGPCALRYIGIIVVTIAYSRGWESSRPVCAGAGVGIWLCHRPRLSSTNYHAPALGSCARPINTAQSRVLGPVAIGETQLAAIYPMLFSSIF